MKTPVDYKMKKWIQHANMNENKVRVVILISDKVDFKEYWQR